MHPISRKPALFALAGIVIMTAAIFRMAEITPSNTEGSHSTKTSAEKTRTKPARNTRRTQEQTPEELQATATARPCDATVLTSLDLTRPPTEAELIAAGNLGKKLTPTRSADPGKIKDPAARKQQELDNLTFGNAIQAWNEHRYQEAIQLFGDHLAAFPNSPWAAESMLHIGCFCEYNARFGESAEWFDKSIAAAGDSSEMLHKAKLRRAMVDVLLGNLDEASKKLAETLKTNTSEEENTYASYWITQTAFLKKNEAILRDCGQKALSKAAEILGNDEQAKTLYSLPSAGPHGFKASELYATALQHGLDPYPVNAALALDKLPVPFVAHYNDKHYVTVEAVSRDTVRLHDSRMSMTTEMPRGSFEREWSGFALLMKEPPADKHINKAENLDAISGGCCGIDMLVSNLGREPGEDIHCGLPGYSVNPINMNFKVIDTPMWWDSPVGPDIAMTVMFNSQDSQNHYTPFGNKWSFEYASYLMITPAVLSTTPPTPAQVQVRDGDGRIEAFTATTVPQNGQPVTYPVDYHLNGDFRKLRQTAAKSFTLTHEDGTIYNYGIPAAMAGNADVPLLLSIVDRHNNTVTITHNANGAITQIAHSALPGNTWSITYETIAGVARITKIEDPFGRSATFGYDANARLVTQTDMGALTYSYTYTDPTAGAPLFVTSITTPTGTTTIHTEIADGIENYTDAESYPANEIAKGYGFDYPMPDRIMWDNYRITVKDHLQNPTEYFYDGNNQKIYIRTPAQMARPVGTKINPQTGSSTRIEASLVGDRGVITTTIGTNEAGEIVLKEEDRNISETTRLPTNPADGHGGNHYLEYNFMGKPTVVIPHSEVNDDNQIVYTYMANGVDIDTVTRKFDGIEKTLADYAYYPNRDIQSVTDVTGRTISFVWKTNGLPETITDSATGDVISFTYDSRLRPETVKVNGSVVSTTTYDTENIGNLVARMDADGRTAQYQYDGLNRMTREDASDNSFTVYDWACCFIDSIRHGKMVGGAEKTLRRSVTRHDARGLPVQTTDTDGSITLFEYDNAGRFVKLTDPRKQVTEWQYNALGQLTGKKYPNGSTETFSYAEYSGVLESTTNRKNLTTRIYYGYDHQPTQFRTQTQDLSEITRQTFLYDTWRRPYSISFYDIDYEPTTHVIDHDLLGRVTSIDGPWADDTISFSYGDATRSVTRTSPGDPNQKTETTTRDALGDIAAITNALGTFTHNRSGLGELLNSITHTGTNAGFNTAFSYHDDTQNRALASITATKPGGTMIGKQSYTYDSLGQIDTWKREANLANPSGQTKSYEWKSRYDLASQLVSIAEKSLSGIPKGGWDYKYDSAGNISSIQTETPGNPVSLTSHTHNSLNQITGIVGGGVSTIRGTLSEPGTASVGHVGQGDKPARMLADNRFEADVPLQPGINSLAITALDTSGNRSNYRFSINVAAQPARAFQYDNAGNLLSDCIRNYEWDMQSRLKKIHWDATKTTEFRYNALGQRSERIERTGTTETAHFYYLYDGIRLLARYNGGTAAANIDRHYLGHGEQRKIGGVWTTYYYTRDHLGSIREVVQANGTLAARYDYDPYGRRTAQYEATGYTGGCDLGFTGHITVNNPIAGQTELVMTAYRAYDPQLGRWLSPDPLGEAGGINLYKYCKNNPIGSKDPLGLWQITISGGNIWGAHFTIGNNGGDKFLNGQWNFGLKFGIGYGTSISIDGNNTGYRKCGPSFGLNTSGAIGNGPLGVNAGYDYDSKAGEGDLFYGGRAVYFQSSTHWTLNDRGFLVTPKQFLGATNLGASVFTGIGVNYATKTK